MDGPGAKVTDAARLAERSAEQAHASNQELPREGGTAYESFIVFNHLEQQIVDANVFLPQMGYGYPGYSPNASSNGELSEAASVPARHTACPAFLHHEVLQSLESAQVSEVQKLIPGLRYRALVRGWEYQTERSRDRWWEPLSGDKESLTPVPLADLPVGSSLEELDTDVQSLTLRVFALCPCARHPPGARSPGGALLPPEQLPYQDEHGSWRCEFATGAAAGERLGGVEGELAAGPFAYFRGQESWRNQRAVKTIVKTPVEFYGTQMVGDCDGCGVQQDMAETVALNEYADACLPAGADRQL